ncbi:MAG: GNAT family N-acetyltransferase [Chloroflexi bacterium]|nr:GNAT family N-acetyltransferase [Chloroflexota bacterium]
MNLQLRNFRPGDEPAILDLARAADAVDHAERGLSAADLDEWLHAPNQHPESDYFLAQADGQPAGFVGVNIEPGTHTAHRAVARGLVHPSYRRRGIGTQLMQAAEARAAKIVRALPGGLPGHFDTFCRSFQSDHIALFEARGMKPVRYFLNMQRDLTRDLPAADVAAPEGIVIRAYRDKDDAATLAAFNDAFQDQWGFEPMPAGEWRHAMRGVPYFRPELWLLAWARDEIAGFTLNFVDPDYYERVGRKEGYVAEVGVRRPWRQRGLATALLARSLQALRAAGMDSALLGVDSESPTNAVRLYERVGFCELRRNVLYRKTL